MNKTFKSKHVEGFTFNLLSLPGSNYFKIEVVNMLGSNIERVINKNFNKNVYGLSHFVEHLSFRATKDYTSEELLRHLKSDGDYNASTDHDRINYYFTTTMQRMSLAIKLVCNYTFNHLRDIPDDEFNIEKKVVFNEAKRYADDDQTMFYFNSTPAACGFHVEDNVIGIPETIDTFTKDDAILIKDIFLRLGVHVFNITFDPLKKHEDEVIDKVLSEIKRFNVESTPRLNEHDFSVSKDYYSMSTYPTTPSKRHIPNDSEQAMTMLILDNIQNIYTARLANSYLCNYSSSSLDDVIREKNGLTYGVSLSDGNISYAPYTFFSCDVSRGTEKTLMELFKESINKSVNEFSSEKHMELMNIMHLKRTLSYIDQRRYEGFHNMAVWNMNILYSVKEELNSNIDDAIIALDKKFANFDTMKEYLNNFKDIVNSENYCLISNVG